ncbi:hypothetical protein GP486_008487 [Trichoglossum hirsutum]|uniref:Uncharacterized protein n=1 Tax=Trichoglossum hirsutum TaxID=265104 RepID=A0A9P8I7V0_9PEZI|nr:hypothetical protein GP486_008487 [Trichoglossum hirsutum]
MISPPYRQPVYNPYPYETSIAVRIPEARTQRTKNGNGSHGNTALETTDPARKPGDDSGCQICIRSHGDSINGTSIYGSGNLVYGDGNLVFGTGNSIHGDGNLIFGTASSIHGNANLVYGTGNLVYAPAGPAYKTSGSAM